VYHGLKIIFNAFILPKFRLGTIFTTAQLTTKIASKEFQNNYLASFLVYIRVELLPNFYRFTGKKLLPIFL